MIRAVTILMLTVFAARGQTDTQIVDAIFIAEGGTNTTYPYGVKSIRTTSTEHARRICMNTVRNNRRRWEAAGSPGDFIDFLADRYCPPSADPVGNQNWKRNVKRISRSAR